MRSITLDRSRWEAEKQRVRSFLNERMEEVRARTEEAAKIAAHTVATELAKGTWPVGPGVPLGLGAIESDIKSVFLTVTEACEILKKSVSHPVAMSFYAAYKSGQAGRALTILQKSGGPLAGVGIGPLDPRMHQTARTGKYGHVIPQHRRIVPSEQRQAYVKEIQTHLGAAASGWAACAAQLGGESGIPNWKSTSVHGADRGRASLVSTAATITWKLENLAPNARRLTAAGVIARALAAGRAKFEEVMNRPMSSASMAA